MVAKVQGLTRQSSELRSGGYNVETPDRLLDAAERLFAERHYSNVTLGQIAQEAGANVGQIVYHFQRKEGLIRRTILRRAGILNQERLELLRNYENLVGAENVETIPLVRAFLSPYFTRLEAGDRQWRCFAMFVGRTVWDGRLAEHMTASFDDTASLFIAAFRRALPGLSRKDAVRGFQFMLALMHVATTNDPRVGALLGTQGGPVNYGAYYRMLVPYIAAGFHATPR
jgi:AcrR family transcriptional regulator